jgi:hypothetical protein
MTSWQRSDNWQLTGPNNENLGVKNVRYVAARDAVSFALHFNHTIPFYSQHEVLAKALFYFGAAAGPVIVGNDGNVSYSKANPNTPSEFIYTSAYHFESGFGFMLGGQVGFNYYLSERVGINVQVAPSIAWVQTNDSRMNGANNQFHINYCSRTIGIRYRF